MSVLRHLHPVIASKRVPRGRVVRLQIDGEAFALFRAHDGKVGALADACPHRHAPLSNGRVRDDGRLMCGYHGWRFDTDGKGESVTGATHASCDTRALRVVEQYGYVWLQSRDAAPKEVPPLARDGYSFDGAFSMHFDAPMPVVLDNFSENEHVPFVHTRLGWDEAALGTVRFEAKNFDDRTEVDYRARQRWSPLLRIFTLAPGDTYHNTWTTRFDPVRTEYAIHWTRGDTDEARPLLTRSTIFFVPETERTTWLHVFVTTRIAPHVRVRAPLFRLAARALGWWEVRDDARFVRTLADTARTLEGMKLGKFDKPVIHNRKLLQLIYRGLAVDAPRKGVLVVAQ